jgi:hypothetical protein
LLGVAPLGRATFFEGVAEAFGAWPLAAGVAEGPFEIGPAACLGAIGIAFRGVADLEGVVECRDGIPTEVDSSITAELPSRDGELTEWPVFLEAPAGDREAEPLSRKAGLPAGFSIGRGPVFGDLTYLMIGVTTSDRNVAESSFQPTLSLIIAEIASPPSLGVSWIATILRNSPFAQGPSVMDGRPYPTVL